MRITNKHGLPGVFVKLMERDSYTKGAASFSVTELLMPPRIRLLRMKHDHEMERDVADSLWALMGRAVHEVFEGGATAGTIAEQRLYADFDGIRVSGAIDLQVLDGVNVDIKDFKFTSVWSLLADKIEWEQQLNCYAQLARMNGRVPQALHVVAILRDWSRAEAERGLAVKPAMPGAIAPSYPQAPVQQVMVPIWDEAKAKQFIMDRIIAHTSAGFYFEMDRTQDVLPECSAEERWEKEKRYAVMLPGRKKASRVLDTQEQASAYAVVRNIPEYVIEPRGGESLRCTRNYCGVSEWCEQYAKTKAEND